MPKKRPAGGSFCVGANPTGTPLRRSRRFHPHAETLTSSDPVSPRRETSEVHALHRPESPKELPPHEANKIRQREPANARRGRSGEGIDANARVPRRSSRLNHLGEEGVRDVENEKVSRLQKKDRVESVECRRGRSRGFEDSSCPVVAVSLAENNEGEPRKELRRSHRRIGATAVVVNATEPPESAAEVVSGVEAQSTPRTVEKKEKRKRRRQMTKAKEEAFKAGTGNAGELEHNGKSVEVALKDEFPLCKKLRRLEGDQAISAANKVTEDVAVVVSEDNAHATPNNRHKPKTTYVTMLPMAACKKKAKKPRSDAVMANAGGNKKGVVGAGTVKDGKSIQDWTSEQDKALQRAYIVARPSPHFWKNVSKMVSGKSAKECFNRIHSFLTTPPVPQPRAKVKKSEQSPMGHFSLSGGSCSSTFEEKLKKTRSTKQRKLLAQKTVRHILKKQSLQEQAQETDMFPVFQSSLNISAEELPTTCMSPTPACQLKFIDSPKSGNGNLPTAKKSLPRRVMISPNEPSPEVLKQVKNLAQHERYVDRLHGRVSSWQPSSMLSISVSEAQGKENMVPYPVHIKAAKNALLFDAIEAMREFRRLEDLSTNLAIQDDENDDDGGGEESGISESEDT